jgi:DNA primase
VLALDPDLAGSQATLRGLAVARQTLDRQVVPVPTARGYIRYESHLDADIRIMTLPKGKDPDDVIRETPELWDALVEAAIPVVDYYFQVSTRDVDLDSAKGKSEAVRRLAPVLADIQNEVERSHYVQKLARLIRVDEATVRQQLGVGPGQRRRARTRPKPRAEAEPKPTARRAPAIFALEEHCLAAFLRRPEFLTQANEVLDSLDLVPVGEDDFERAENRALLKAWLQFEGGQDWQAWVDALPQLLQLHLDFLLERGLDTEELVGQDAERDIERRILELRRRRIDRMVQNLRMLQMEALDRGDAKASEYGQDMQTLTIKRIYVERALYERTATGKRAQREQVV